MGRGCPVFAKGYAEGIYMADWNVVSISKRAPVISGWGYRQGVFAP